MTTPPATHPPRPRTVTVAFWCWVVAAVLLVVYGMVLVSSALSLPLAVRGFGALWMVAGLALGYFAGKAGRGSARFRRMGVALAFTAAVLMVLLFPDLLGIAVAILGVVGSVAILRPTASEWFTAVDHAAGRAGG